MIFLTRKRLQEEIRNAVYAMYYDERLVERRREIQAKIDKFYPLEAEVTKLGMLRVAINETVNPDMAKEIVHLRKLLTGKSRKSKHGTN